MIKIIAGGKKNSGWVQEATIEYEKRLNKPFDIKWEFYDEEKLSVFLEKWPFSGRDFVIVCDERGENISSPDFSEKLSKAFVYDKNVVILIGGAFGFSENVRKNSNFVWSFSKLVFPHLIARLIVCEQIYRAQEISKGGKYHHE